MKTRRASSHDPSYTKTHWLERCLQAIGANSAFAESVLGDLSEEFSVRSSRDGARAARRWYVREALRSVPYLAYSALHQLDTVGRLRVLAVVAGTPLALTLALVWLSSGVGAPVRLTAGTRDTVVVNHVRAVSFPIRVLDAAGKVLSDTGVRYIWTGGAPAEVTPRGVVTCLGSGNTKVRASLGPLTTDVVLLCRPVSEAKAAIWNDFILGEPARELPAEFLGLDGEPVTLLSARISIRDSNVATLKGLTIYPLRPGRTHLWLTIGNRTAGGSVRVFAPVATLNGVRPETNPDQQFVAAPVRLDPGDTLRWSLPEGLFNLVFLPHTFAEPMGSAAPIMRVEGPIMCMPALAVRAYNTRCLVRSGGAVITLAHPGKGGRAVVGSLALDWERLR